MSYEITMLTTMGIAVIFALSLNLITGFCGQVSLGHAAFFGAGAYTSALLTKAGLPMLAALAPAMLVAGALGAIVGFASLRVRHDFLAITTMGVGFLFLGFVRGQEALGGEMGISGISSSGLGKGGFLILIGLLAAAVVAFSTYLKRSWMGFAFDAIADNEDTARLAGIDVARFKLVAFAMGTALAGLAGALYAHHVRFIDAESFGFVESITVLSMVIVGGIGSVPGVVLAAAVLSVLPLWFQFVDDYKLLLYSALLFAMVRFYPKGLGGMIDALRCRWGRA